ncbi:MAG: class I SAM-dependent methyltransferase [Deltaproteobacteria bacterium]|nr:class I SAM-dependent methyltransferase [Deltaproteobacteria bacterium]
MRNVILTILMTAALLALSAAPLLSQEQDRNASLDRKVRAFLDARSGNWRDLNVPASDGKLLHDIILRNNYRQALEIGTSTGHSAIWIAWALSRTGGKLITVEIDEARHKQALANFREAGLSEYIDARLGDAHELVPKLPGPFDFVFSDADKDWYRNYFDAVAPKLKVGGAYVSHNVSDRGWNPFGLGKYVDYIKGRKDFETTFDDNGAGVSVSYKKR